MLNHITIMGRLTRDPEMRRTGSGLAVTSFTVAVERDIAENGQKVTDFLDCVAWRQTGEFVSKYFRKGSMIVVSGRLQINGWTDKNGNKRKSAEILAGNCYFGESKRSDESNASYGGISGDYTGANGYPETQDQIRRMQEQGYDYNIPYPGTQGNFAEITDDDGELPF